MFVSCQQFYKVSSTVKPTCQIWRTDITVDSWNSWSSEISSWSEWVKNYKWQFPIHSDGGWRRQVEGDISRFFLGFNSLLWCPSEWHWYPTYWLPRVATYHPPPNSHDFPWHFAVFHTLEQIKKSFLFFSLMVLTVSLKIWGLLLKERICSPREQILSFKSSPQWGGRWA